MTFELHPAPTAPAHRPLARTSLTTHEQIGFELGWDYAHHRMVPPAPYAQEPSPLRDGLLAGQAAFGIRTLPATRHVRKWLQLRLHAWLRGRSVELLQITPHYLKLIDVSHCPVTRVALTAGSMTATDASVDRLRSDAAYAAGNLAVMSTKANHAKAARGRLEAMAMAERIEADGVDGMKGLTAAQWRRVAVLCSFVEPMSHEAACQLPLLVLPPSRVRLFNPVQALQAFISQQLLVPGWSHRIARFEAMLPGKALRRSFQTFFHALLPRVLEAGRSGAAATTPARVQAQRWAIEDAWQSQLARQRWIAFASQLTAAQCEALVVRATARKLGTARVQQVDDALALDGWQLESKGYVPHAVLMRRSARAGVAAVRLPVQAHLPLH